MANIKKTEDSRSDFASGTLKDVIATNEGSLELQFVATKLDKVETSKADFDAGTLTKVATTSAGDLQLGLDGSDVNHTENFLEGSLSGAVLAAGDVTLPKGSNVAYAEAFDGVLTDVEIKNGQLTLQSSGVKKEYNETTKADFETGILSNVVASIAGDLELARDNETVYTDTTDADFNAGTLINTAVENGSLSAQFTATTFSHNDATGNQELVRSDYNLSHNEALGVDIKLPTTESTFTHNEDFKAGTLTDTVATDALQLDGGDLVLRNQTVTQAYEDSTKEQFQTGTLLKVEATDAGDLQLRTREGVVIEDIDNTDALLSEGALTNLRVSGGLKLGANPYNTSQLSADKSAAQLITRGGFVTAYSYGYAAVGNEYMFPVSTELRYYNGLYGTTYQTATLTVAGTAATTTYDKANKTLYVLDGSTVTVFSIVENPLSATQVRQFTLGGTTKSGMTYDPDRNCLWTIYGATIEQFSLEGTLMKTVTTPNTGVGIRYEQGYLWTARGNKAYMGMYAIQPDTGVVVFLSAELDITGLTGPSISSFVFETPYSIAINWTGASANNNVLVNPYLLTTGEDFKLAHSSTGIGGLGTNGTNILYHKYEQGTQTKYGEWAFGSLSINGVPGGPGYSEYDGSTDTNGTVQAFAHDGTNFYFVYGTAVYKTNTATKVFDIPAVIGTATGLVWNGTNFIITSRTNRKYYEVSKTGSILRTVDMPKDFTKIHEVGDYIYGDVFDGTDASANKLLKMDKNWNVVVEWPINYRGTSKYTVLNNHRVFIWVPGAGYNGYSSFVELYTPQEGNYISSGTRSHANLSIDSIKRAKSVTASWNEVLNGGTVKVELSVNGSTWVEATNGTPVSLFNQGEDMTDKYLYVRETLSTPDSTQTPVVSNIMVRVEDMGGAGETVSFTETTQADFEQGTLTNVEATAEGDLQLTTSITEAQPTVYTVGNTADDNSLVSSLNFYGSLIYIKKNSVLTGFEQFLERTSSVVNSYVAIFEVGYGSTQPTLTTSTPSYLVYSQAYNHTASPTNGAWTGIADGLNFQFREDTWYVIGIYMNGGYKQYRGGVTGDVGDWAINKGGYYIHNTSTMNTAPTMYGQSKAFYSATNNMYNLMMRYTVKPIKDTYGDLLEAVPNSAAFSDFRGIAYDPAKNWVWMSPNSNGAIIAYDYATGIEQVRWTFNGILSMHWDVETSTLYGAGSAVYKYTLNPDGTYVGYTTLTTTGASNIRGVTIGGGYLWVYYGEGYVGQYPLAGGSAIKTIRVVPLVSQAGWGLHYDNGYLWVGTGSKGAWYKVDPVDGKVIGNINFVATNGDVTAGPQPNTLLFAGGTGDAWAYKVSTDASSTTVAVSPTGNRVSPSLDFSAIKSVKESTISWTQSTPAGTTVALSVSTDGGATYTPVTNGGSFLPINTDMTGKTVLVKASFTSDGAASPTISDITMTATGNDLFEANGYRTHTISLSDIDSATIQWEHTSPANTNIAVETSFDGASWAPVVNGASIPGFVNNTDGTLYIRETLSTTDNLITPKLHNIKVVTSATGYLASGSRTSPSISVPTDLVKNARISWHETKPAGTSVEIQVSVNGGTWITVANGGALPGFTVGQNAPASIQVKQLLFTDNADVSPSIHDVTVIVDEYKYQTSYTRTSALKDVSSIKILTTSTLSVAKTTPTGTSVKVEASLDGVSWTEVTSNLGLAAGTNLTGKNLYVRQTLSTTDVYKTPTLSSLSYTLNGYEYATSKKYTSTTFDVASKGTADTATVTWTENKPAGTDVKVYLILPNGTKVQVTNGQNVASITGQLLESATMKFEADLTTTNIANTPTLSAISISGTGKRYDKTAVRTAPARIIGIASVASSQIAWNADIPAGNLVVETSLDSGTTWQPATNGGAISGISKGDNLSSTNLLVKVTLTGGITGTPKLDDISWNVSGGFLSNGTRTLNPITLDTVGIAKSSRIVWNKTEPAGTSSKVELRVSTNGGVTYGEWTVPVSGAAIPGITKGMDMEGVIVEVRQTLLTTDVSLTPQIHDLSIEVDSGFKKSGTHVSNPVSIGQAELVATSLLDYARALPVGTNATVETRISDDNGVTWGAWQVANDSEPIPGIASGVDVTGKAIQVRQTLTTTDVAVAPTFDSLGFTVDAGYKTGGQYHSVVVDKSTVGVAAGSQISWMAITPLGTSVTAETSVDGGASWQVATNGGTVPNVDGGDTVQVRFTLNTTDYTKTPSVDSLWYTISSGYAVQGVRTSPAYTFPNAGKVSTSRIKWNATTPAGTTLIIETSIDNGVTWQIATNGYIVPGITGGTTMDDKSIMVRQTLKTNATAVTPVLHDITLTIEGGGYKASGYRISPAIALDTVGTVSSNEISWISTEPLGTTVEVQAAITGSNTTPPPDEQFRPLIITSKIQMGANRYECVGKVEQIVADTDMGGLYLWIKEILTTEDVS